jgi:methionine synthase II (cobalamin-independent)
MASLKRSPPFRAEHVGSLLRPQELVQKRYDVASGKAQPDELVPLEDKSVAEVVKFQQDCGLKVVSSGEYTRSVAWHICQSSPGLILGPGTCSGAPFLKRFTA